MQRKSWRHKLCLLVFSKDFICIGFITLVVMAIHMMVSHNHNVCVCPSSQDKTSHVTEQNATRNVIRPRDQPSRDSKQYQHRHTTGDAIPTQPPRTDRQVSRDLAPRELADRQVSGFTLDNLEYGINISASLEHSIEGVSISACRHIRIGSIPKPGGGGGG